MFPAVFEVTETEVEIGERSQHFLAGAARRTAKRVNARRCTPALTYRAVRYGRLDWRVVAFQNIALPAGERR